MICKSNDIAPPRRRVAAYNLKSFHGILKASMYGRGVILVEGESIRG